MVHMNMVPLHGFANYPVQCVVTLMIGNECLNTCSTFLAAQLRFEESHVQIYYMTLGKKIYSLGSEGGGHSPPPKYDSGECNTLFIAVHLFSQPAIYP